MAAEHEMDPDDQRESRRWTLGAALVLTLVAIVAGLMLWDWLGTRAAPVATDRPAAAQEAGPACTLGIGAADDGAPTARVVTLPPGAAVVVAARCAPGVQVVDLVVAAPAPHGAMLVLATVPDKGVWRWEGELADNVDGLELRFYVFADGRPAGKPVMLMVQGG